MANAGLIKKVYLPREVFPLSTAARAVQLRASSSCVLAGATVVGRRSRGPRLPTCPWPCVLLVVFGTALALLLSAVNVYLRDVQHLIEIVMLILLLGLPDRLLARSYVNPFLKGGRLEQLYLANPVTLAILAFQRGMWTPEPTEPFPANMPPGSASRSWSRSSCSGWPSGCSPGSRATSPRSCEP